YEPRQRQPGKLDSADESDDGDAQSPSEVGREFAPIETAYLKQLKVTHRARVRETMRWRPRFLKALRAAGVAYNTYRAHIQNDPDFAEQVGEAEKRAAHVLHAAAWSRAVEG